MIAHHNEMHFIQLRNVVTNVKFPPKSMTNVTFFKALFKLPQRFALL